MDVHLVALRQVGHVLLHRRVIAWVKRRHTIRQVRQVWQLAVWVDIHVVAEGTELVPIRNPASTLAGGAAVDTQRQLACRNGSRRFGGALTRDVGCRLIVVLVRGQVRH